MATRRQQLITQMRQALNELQKPYLYDADEENEDNVVFQIADMEFEFTQENLNEDIGVL